MSMMELMVVIVGHPIGRSNQNPILKTYLYKVEFPVSEITEMAVNIITESMFDLCDVNDNEFFVRSLY